ncbi:MAG: SLBB domain-containing protein, partial [Candidatus Neomarinimicrobiota bacterium]
AVLEQFDDENLERRSILFNLNDRSTYESVEMIANSNLYFFNIYQMESFTKYLLEGNEDVYEDVYEEVNKVNFSSENFNERLSDISKNLINDYTLLINHMGTPYYLPVYGKFKLESFVNFLGLDMTNVDDEVTYIKPLDDSITEDSYKNINFSASKYNAVSFRSPGNDLINVEVSGAIEYPGTYTLKSNATLEDLYQYVGNFKGEAFPDGIIFIRESIKERQLKSLQESRNLINNFLISQDQDSNSISNLGKINQLSESIDVDNLGRLSGNFSPTSKSINKTILRDGDSIKVPIIPSTISVLGEVQNQLTFEYEENINVSTAIKMAGGFNDFSNKRGVYIIKANGLTLKANSFIIGNSKLDVGDTVIVPRKLITENPLIKALQPVTQVISDLAFSAAALESLSNSNK